MYPIFQLPEGHKDPHYTRHMPDYFTRPDYLPYSGPHTRDTHAHHDHLLAVLLVSLPLSIQITTHFTRMGKREGGERGARSRIRSRGHFAEKT